MCWCYVLTSRNHALPGTLPPRGRDASHSRSCPADLPPKATPNRSKGSLGSILQSSLSLSRLGSSARSSTNATSTAGMSRSSSGDGSSAQGATQQQGSRSIDALPTSARGEADARTEVSTFRVRLVHSCTLALLVQPTCLLAQLIRQSCELTV